MTKALTFRKAQFFSIDFMLAVVTFSIIVFASVLIWRNVDFRADRVDKRSELEVIASTVVSTIMSGPGDPHGWYLLNSSEFTEANIMTLGVMKNNGVLDVERVRKLETESADKYEVLRNLLGVHSYDVDFQITMLSGESPLGVKFEDIAYTYGEGEPEEGDANHSGIRNYMEELGIEFDNYGADWQGLINNIDNYSITIWEDPTLDQNDITGATRTKLKDWVSNGGILFQKEHGQMLEIFNPIKFVQEVTNEQGQVVMENPVLKWMKTGDDVVFKEGLRINKNFGNWTTFITGPEDHPLFAKVQYGQGWLFYLPDTEGTVTSGGNLTFDNIMDALDLAGYFSIGKTEITGNEIVVVERFVPNDGGGTSLITVRVGRP